jgi:N-acetylglucosamine kinase-like BadF-type ATPase
MKRVLAVDGGGSKTDGLVVSEHGEVLAQVRSSGSSPHLIGLSAALEVLNDLVGKLAAITGSAEGPVADHAAIYLSGADLPVEVATLDRAIREAGWARSVHVENDTFALLRAGTRSPDAVAVVCGSGINCVGVSRFGGVARFPSLGRLSGDWGGGSHLGSETLWWAVRAEDGRGEPTALQEEVHAHFGMRPGAVGAAIHLGEMDPNRLGELTPVLFRVASEGDQVALRLVERQAEEVCAFAAVALRRLDLDRRAADVVLGGSVITARSPLLIDGITSRLAERAPYARTLIVDSPPVLGAALLGLDALRASPDAESRLRAAL